MNRASVEAVAVLDVGGTSIKLGAVHGASATVAPSVPTLAQGPAHVVIGQLQRAVDASIACTREVHAGVPAGVAVAFPGPFDLIGGRPLLRGLGKFDTIHGRSLHDELDTSGLPLVFVRDSEAAAVGEARFGAGAGTSRVLTVALGTGFGSCLTVDGNPVPAVDGQTIEALHELETPDGRVDDVLSAIALAQQLGVTATELGPLLEARRLVCDQQAALDRYARRLGAFLASLKHLESDLIVIAGGLSGSFDLLRPAISSHLDIPVTAARLGAAGPLLGAAHLAFPENPR